MKNASFCAFDGSYILIRGFQWKYLLWHLRVSCFLHICLLCYGCLSRVHAVVAEDGDPTWEKSPGPNMIDIHSMEQFIHALCETGNKLFYGTWCASCRALYPRYFALSLSYNC